MATTVTLEGVESLQKLLKTYKASVSSKELRSAARFALAPVRKEAIARAPKGSRAHKTRKGQIATPGFLSRQIQLKTYRIKGGRGGGAFVNVNLSKAPYAIFVGSGYRAHGGRGRGVKFGRTIAGRPFMRPAMENNESQVASRFEAQLVKRLKAKGSIV